MLDKLRQDQLARRLPAPLVARVSAGIAFARNRLAPRFFALSAGAAVLLMLAAVTALTLPAAVSGWLVLTALALAIPLPSAPAPEVQVRDRRLPAADAAQIWRSLVDALPDAAMVIDGSGHIVEVNTRARAHYPSVRSGVPLSAVTRNPDLLTAIDRVGRGGEAVDVEIVERTPVERRFQTVVAALAGSPQMRLLLTFRDVTEQDRLARMRADFIANASHELRTPLASLRGFVETLQGPARDDAKARERFLGLMASQATRMTRLIDDLLSLSRVEMNAHIAPRGSVDLNEVAAHVAETLRPLADAAHIALQVTPAAEPAVMTGSRDEIVQVVSNLVQNAIKYGRDGGHVRVTVARNAAAPAAKPRLTLTVADDGPGIAPEHLPRLTERFYRVSVVDSRDKGGTGLGLAIVKHIVTRHRGELRIESRLGRGSTFAITFDAQNL